MIQNGITNNTNGATLNGAAQQNGGAKPNSAAKQNGAAAQHNSAVQQQAFSSAEMLALTSGGLPVRQGALEEALYSNGSDQGHVAVPIGAKEATPEGREVCPVDACFSGISCDTPVNASANMAVATAHGLAGGAAVGIYCAGGFILALGLDAVQILSALTSCSCEDTNLVHAEIGKFLCERATAVSVHLRNMGDPVCENMSKLNDES